MRRTTAVTAALVGLLLSTPGAESQVRLSGFLQVLGNVTNAARPVDNVLVVAFNLSNYHAVHTRSDRSGRFRLPPLPVGVYRVIAVKAGFAAASATITPSRRGHTLALRLENQDTETARSAAEDVWEIRRALPPDILRELDFEQTATAAANSGDQRVHGAMASTAAVSGNHDEPALAQTTVGVSGRLGSGWSVDLAGDMHRVSENVGNIESELGRSQGVVMQVTSAAHDRYRVTSRVNSWRRDGDRANGPTVDYEYHEIGWQGEASNVGVRYVSHANLFRTAPLQAERIEISGEKMLSQSARGSFGMLVRLAQDRTSTISTTELDTRSADVAAVGRYRVLRSTDMHYGVKARVSDGGSEWAPHGGVELHLGDQTMLVASGQYKIVEERFLDPLPATAYAGDLNWLSPRYRYTFGVVRGEDDTNRFSAVATVSAMDSDLRMVFDERFEQFWDGFYLQAGEKQQDVTFAYRREGSSGVAFDFATSAGRVAAPDATHADKQYVAGRIQSIYRPSRTSLDVSYRQVNQPTPMSRLRPEDSERLNLRLAQSLFLPLDLRLLVGLDVSRATSSKQGQEPQDQVQRRVLGGVSLAF